VAKSCDIFMEGNWMILTSFYKKSLLVAMQYNNWSFLKSSVTYLNKNYNPGSCTVSEKMVKYPKLLLPAHSIVEQHQNAKSSRIGVLLSSVVFIFITVCIVLFLILHRSKVKSSFHNVIARSVSRNGTRSNPERSLDEHQGIVNKQDHQEQVEQEMTTIV